jgi:hypothetical protein
LHAHDTFDRFLSKGAEGLNPSDSSNSNPTNPSTANTTTSSGATSVASASASAAAGAPASGGDFASTIGTFERLLANGATSFGDPNGSVRVYSLPRKSIESFEMLLRNAENRALTAEEAEFFGLDGVSNASGTLSRENTLERLMRNGAASVGVVGGGGGVGGGVGGVGGGGEGASGPVRVYSLSRNPMNSLERKLTTTSISSVHSVNGFHHPIAEEQN